MRKKENLAYTPASDIVHEAAGHAPILADPKFESYLRHYGEISRKTIISTEDWDVYLAIRDLPRFPSNRPAKRLTVRPHASR